ncbi:MAG: type III polyketide synthase [Trueperaceae bacterium]|nr:type III polyketide synthase [Trueperaceae bacterium]
MPIALHAVGTALPPHRYPQPYVREVMGRWVGGERRTDKLLDRVYAASAIDARHSVLDDFLPDRATNGAPALFLDADGGFRSPSTGQRNALYAEHAPGIAEAAARDALAAGGELTAADVTHLITVSCTGFYTPGVDLHLQRALGLDAAVERYHLGFMGCFAAFPALRMARAFCSADPRAVVLIVTVELCTLHLQPGGDVDGVLAASVFADGAAAAIVSARPPSGPQRPLALERHATAVTRDGADDMAWTIGDTGFDMTLTAYVPRVLEAEAAGALAPLFASAGVAAGDVRWWAVHPGGRAIVDKVVAAMGLPEAAVAASRAVLRRAGNMSSATVLFVLRELMDRALPGPEAGEPLVALAFGPGLTVDSALMRAL